MSGWGVAQQTGSYHSFTWRSCPQSQSEALLPAPSISGAIPDIVGRAIRMLERSWSRWGSPEASGGEVLRALLTSRLKTLETHLGGKGTSLESIVGREQGGWPGGNLPVGWTYRPKMLSIPCRP